MADTVANEFEMEAEKISIEMLFCSFYRGRQETPVRRQEENCALPPASFITLIMPIIKNFRTTLLLILLLPKIE
ncbi:MAG: hypothetical protein ACYTXC_00225, partial [Nostoc sp.]